MHVLVFGSNSAIGQNLVTSYLDEGAHVTAVYHKQNDLQPYGDRLNIVNSLDKLPIADTTIILNAKASNARLDRMTDEQWAECLEATLTYPFKALRRTLQYLRKGSSVVVVGSIVGSSGGYGCGNYAAAKSGLEGLVRAAANEHPDIRINLLELGYVNAGMGASLPSSIVSKIVQTIPMGRFAEVDEVVHAVKFLASQTYMTGNTLTFAGGLR